MSWQRALALGLCTVAGVCCLEAWRKLSDPLLLTIGAVALAVGSIVALWKDSRG